MHEVRTSELESSAAPTRPDVHYLNATHGPMSWFFTKDRVVGYVEIEATQDASVESFSGRVARGYAAARRREGSRGTPQGARAGPRRA